MRTLRISVQAPTTGDAVFPVIARGDQVRVGGDPTCDVTLIGSEAAAIELTLRQANAPDRRWFVDASAGGAGARIGDRQLPPGGSAPLVDGVEIALRGYLLVVRLLSPRALQGSSPGLTGEELGRRLQETVRDTGTVERGAVAVPRRRARAPIAGAEVLVVINGPQRGRATPSLRRGQHLSVGRSSACQITLPDPRISRRHAQLGRDRRGLWVRNAGGVGGVRVNGKVSRGRRRLEMGDLIDIGGTRLEVRYGGGAAYEQIAPVPGALQGVPRRAAHGPDSILRLWARFIQELDLWEVVDPAGLALGLAGLAAGLAAVAVGLGAAVFRLGAGA